MKSKGHCYHNIHNKHALLLVYNKIFLPQSKALNKIKQLMFHLKNNLNPSFLNVIQLYHGLILEDQSPIQQLPTGDGFVPWECLALSRDPRDGSVPPIQEEGTVPQASGEQSQGYGQTFCNIHGVFPPQRIIWPKISLVVKVERC